MLKETMTSQERVDAALRLEKTDRTPVGALVLPGFAYKYMGLNASQGFKDRLERPDMNVRVTENEVLQSAVEKSERLNQIMSDFFFTSGLDLIHGGGLGDMPNASMPVLPRLTPGIDLPDNVEAQEIHEVVMQPNEYDRLLDIGPEAFWLEMVNRVVGRVEEGKARGRVQYLDYVRLLPRFRNEIYFNMDMVRAARKLNAVVDQSNKAYYEKKGIPFLVDAVLSEPVGMLQWWRTFPELMVDIERQYNKVKASVEMLIEYWTELLIKACHNSKRRRILAAGALITIPNVTRKVFEELQWSWMVKLTNICIEEGVMPIFHLDSDWTETLPYFRTLPRGKFAIQLDGTTDIFKAKELFKGHACVIGDVPAAMLCTASSDEVENYCKELIDVVGKDGGFILWNGCALPVSAKTENVDAMVRVAKNYAGKQ